MSNIFLKPYMYQTSCLLKIIIIKLLETFIRLHKKKLFPTIFETIKSISIHV